MITQNSANVQPQTWQQSLAEAIRDPAELLDILELGHIRLAHEALIRDFPLLVPRSFVARMRKGDPRDPLLKQILPLADENLSRPGFEKDPLKESEQNPIPGMLQKYQGRVLLTLSSACAVNCRYCFRRHFPYNENNPGSDGWQQVIREVQKSTDISEVILSGGDPLLVNDKSLASLCQQITDIDHVKRLRFHTRIPIVLPERIDQRFIQWISSIETPITIVVHCNHPNELNNAVRKALDPLRDINIHLFNQSVLLKDINDDAKILIELSEKLFDYGVLPYYLHLMDKVENAAHFDTSEQIAKKLLQDISAKLPGYLVPKLAREDPGANSKTLIGY